MYFFSSSQRSRYVAVFFAAATFLRIAGMYFRCVYHSSHKNEWIYWSFAATAAAAVWKNRIHNLLSIIDAHTSDALLLQNFLILYFAILFFFRALSDSTVRLLSSLDDVVFVCLSDLGCLCIRHSCEHCNFSHCSRRFIAHEIYDNNISLRPAQQFTFMYDEATSDECYFCTSRHAKANKVGIFGLEIICLSLSW